MNSILKTLVFTIAATSTFASAASTDTMEGIFNEHFRTLRTEVEGSPLAPPIICLNSEDHIRVSFDELADERSYLRYRLIHCNANWQPSQLVESEYLGGFNQANIDSWDYSRMTTVNYINYSLTLPNPDMQLLVSGNYLLQVYNEDDPDTTLLQTRFMVSECAANIYGDVFTVTDIDYNDSHQQLSLTVDASDCEVDDLFNDLMVYVAQNGRLDNEIAIRHPLRVSGNTAIYEHLRPLIFDAGNEYRRMEIVQKTYPGMRIADVDYFDPYYHATVYTDYPRNQDPYSLDRTQHGRFFVREYNSSRSDLEADYIVTHFSLEMPELAGKSVFLDGDMVHRRFDPSSLMIYNRATGRYEKSLLLKQGAYNYQYLTIGPGDSSGSTADIEGNFCPTNNEYTVKVYHRRRGDRYDRLLGFTLLSHQN